VKQSGNRSSTASRILYFDSGTKTAMNWFPLLGFRTETAGKKRFPFLGSGTGPAGKRFPLLGCVAKTVENRFLFLGSGTGTAENRFLLLDSGTAQNRFPFFQWQKNKISNSMLEIAQNVYKISVTL